MHATIGEAVIHRAPGEPLDAFQDRVLDAATEAGAAFAVVGGLPEARYFDDT